MAVEVRLANLGDPMDAQTIVELELALETPGRARYGYNDMHLERIDTVREQFIPYLQKHRAIVFLAFLDGKAVGIAICEGEIGHLSTWKMKPVLNLHDFFVYEEFRKQGIGSLLLDAFEAYGRANGYCRVNCETSWGNVGARRLYHRRGYVGAGFTADGRPVVFADGMEPDSQLTIQMKLAFVAV